MSGIISPTAQLFVEFLVEGSVVVEEGSGVMQDAMKLLYWTLLIYDYKEVPASPHQNHCLVSLAHTRSELLNSQLCAVNIPTRDTSQAATYPGCNLL